jgi:hypothetical protein
LLEAAIEALAAAAGLGAVSKDEGDVELGHGGCRRDERNYSFDSPRWPGGSSAL